jgi:hypothetical protein
MGWHDNLADRAAAMGKTAIEFRSAAQHKANATWVLLIIAGVIWFFLNWLSLLHPVHFFCEALRPCRMLGWQNL